MKITPSLSKKDALSQRQWLLVDAAGVTLGRLATHVALWLRGKHKPQFTPHVDCGDFVVVINAEKVVLTGKKWEQKKYYRHSRFLGSLKEFTAREMLAKDPTFLVREAVWGMLPKNKLSKQLILKLKVYSGPQHPHTSQKPLPVSLP